MMCPTCGKLWRVKESRERSGKLYRRRVCDSCTESAITVETVTGHTSVPYLPRRPVKPKESK